MNTRYGDWKGKVQGKCYRLWKTDRGYEIEQTWGAGARGVIYTSDNLREAKRYLKRELLAERIMNI